MKIRDSSISLEPHPSKRCITISPFPDKEILTYHVYPPACDAPSPDCIGCLYKCINQQDCPVTEPDWLKFPEDSAVQDPPAYGYYFVNEDRSIWASAGYTQQEEPLRVSKDGSGVKVGWFRPAGAKLLISGQRLDGEAPPLEAHVPCCYPTRFQATGLYFPTDGCWEITARAEDRTLSFVVWVEPE